ncbi:MAG: tRNA (guanosine(37)-N1)-methyltransferase TrmD [Acidobacteriota bacterium]
MNFSIVSIFPELIKAISDTGLLGKAVENKSLGVDIYDLRDFTENKHRKTDDRPYGGGAGMVMTPGPLKNAVEHIKKKREGHVILFSAYGKQLTQKIVKEFSKKDHYILICGRYEGVDQRFIDKYVDTEISIGEYVIMGGELAAGVFMESVGRMIDGVIGNRESVETDSFYKKNQYGFPQYTMPRTFENMDVPDVLLSGNHKNIMEWREKNRKSNK